MSLGATRNITPTFLRYRDAAHGATRPLETGLGGRGGGGTDGSLETGRLLGAALDSSAPVGPSDAGSWPSAVAIALPPGWVDVSEEVAADLARIKEKMGALSKLHGRALLVTFDDDGIDETSVEVLTQEVTRLFKKAEQRLRTLTEGSTGSTEEEKVRKNVLVAWAAELQKLSMDFRKQQKDYLAKVQALQRPGGAVLDFEAQLQNAGHSDPQDVGFTRLQLQQVATSDSLAAERDLEVQNILRSVNDLAQVMKDLSVLVIDQGSILDRIDYNTEQVSKTVESGLAQVVKAEKTQKKGRMMMCIMLLMAAVVFMLIFVLIEKIIF